ncbi:TPA: recombinase RecT [Clostridium perfringens]|nr:recombinase RecT [Clostridium perfringens]
MATASSLKNQLAKKGTGNSLSVGNTVKGLMDSPTIKKRFEEVLNEKAPQYMSSIVNLVNSDTNLQKCEGMSVIASCMVAATMDLPVDKNLGYEWVVPYGNRAQFQMGYKGYIQLALRTGQYKSINVVEIREGELISWNPLTEEIEVDFEKRKSDVVIGYAGYFKLINGFEKTVFWTKEEVNNHANKFSKTVNSKNSVWKSNFDAMAKKTVLRNLLSKWGILSIEMQKAYTADENLINKGLMDDIENVQGNIEDIEENNENEDVIEADYTVDSNNEVLKGQENMFEGTPLQE